MRISQIKSKRNFPGAWEADDIALALGLIEEETRPPIVTVHACESRSVAQCLIVLLEYLIKKTALQQS